MAPCLADAGVFSEGGQAPPCRGQQAGEQVEVVASAWVGLVRG